jgi:hypothetical protein
MSFNTAILEPSRTFSARLTFDTFTLLDDKIIEIKLDSRTMGEGFEIGTAFADVVEIKLFNQSEVLTNKEFELELGLLVGATVEWRTMGYFTVESALVDREVTTLTAIDRMYLLGGQYETTLTFPATVLQVLQDVCTQTGVTLATTTFPNSTVSIPLEPSFLGYSYRNIVARVAEVAGGWAKFNRDGELTILNAVDIDDYVISKSNYVSLSNDEVSLLTIGKVKIQTGEVFAELGTGDEVLIKDNLLVQNPSSFITATYDALNGLSYEPLQVYWQGNFDLSVPRKLLIDGFDAYLFNREILYNGGLRETITTPAQSDVAKQSFTNGALAIAIEQNKAEIKLTQDQISLEIGALQIGAVNLLPLTSNDWQNGTILTGSGNDSASAIRIRTIAGVFYDVKPSTQYTVSYDTPDIDLDVYYYRSDNSYIGRSGHLTVNPTTITTPSDCVKVRYVVRKSDNSNIVFTEINDYRIKFEIGTKATDFSFRNNEMRSAKYVFNNDKARFYSDGQEWYDASNNLRVSFDTVNNRFIFNGEIISDSGQIADFSLIPNYATIVAGTSGKAITGGSGSDRVGMSPGVTTGGFTYSFWAGNDNPINAPFRVLRNGGLRSTDAIIAGWTMSGTSISRGTTILSASGTNGTISINNVVLSSSSGGLLSITGSIALSGDLRPTTTNISDIGTSTIRYRLIYLTNNPNVSSDIRWKENVKVVEDEYKDMILNAEIIEYNLIGSENKQIGINANKFHEQFGEQAELITKLDENGYYGADYVSFVPMLIKTVQSQQKKIDDLEERLAKLEALVK